MGKSIGIGVIGIGMGRDLLYLNDEPESRFQVRGVCSATASKVEAVAKENGIPFWTTEYKKLVERSDIDVIAVYSPDHLHAQHCMDALKADKHVIITKPMVTALEDAIEITRLSEKRNLKFLVGETCRWYTSFLDLRKLYDDDDLGEIIFAEAHYVHEIKDFFTKTTWRLTAPQDFMYGGVCHPLDSLVWFLGDVDEVHCYANKGDLSAYPMEDNFLLNVKFRNGIMARILGAYGVIQPPYPMMGLTIYGNRGTATATFEDFRPSQFRFVLDRFLQNEPAVVDYPADLTGAYGQGDAVRRYMKHFEDCIVNDKPTVEDAREGTKTIAALSAAWESARTGKPVKVRYEISDE
jgi:predicted dehydrogenase